MSSIDPLDERSSHNSELDPVQLSSERFPNETKTEQPIREPTENSAPKKAEPEPEESKPVSVLKILKKFLLVYIEIFVMFVGICSLFWATYYNRQHRYKNLSMLIVSDDVSFEAGNKHVQPLLEDAFKNMTLNDDTVKLLGGWKWANMTEFSQLAKSNGNNHTQELARQVHHQKYWAGIHIAANSTQLIYEAMALADTALLSEISSFITVIYESGRHYSALSQYVTKNLYKTEFVFLDNYVTQAVNDYIIQNLLLSDQISSLTNETTLALINARPVFTFVDERPAASSSILGPSELGLLYAQVFSFHQFNFALEIHAYIMERLRFRHYLIYRVLASHVNFLVLSLVYALVTIAFQVPTGVAFGRAGFLVFWMFMYLFIAAAGGLNELVVSLILRVDKKKLIAPWMIFSLVINISPTFSPFELCPGFFKYGYALPMYNAYELMKVVFFDTYKGHIGRNIGVLLVWIVLTNAGLIWITIWMNRAKKRKLEEEKTEKIEKIEKETIIQENTDTQDSRNQDNTQGDSSNSNIDTSNSDEKSAELDTRT